MVTKMGFKNWNLALLWTKSSQWKVHKNQQAWMRCEAPCMRPSERCFSRKSPLWNHLSQRRKKNLENSFQKKALLQQQKKHLFELQKVFFFCLVLFFTKNPIFPFQPFFFSTLLWSLTERFFCSSLSSSSWFLFVEGAVDANWFRPACADSEGQCCFIPKIVHLQSLFAVRLMF